MGLFARLMSTLLPGRPSDQPLVDQDTRNLLLSAAGNVGGDLFDLLLPAAKTHEQGIVVSWETGFFGVAAACHYFTVRYATDLPRLSLAIEIAEVYRRHCFELNAAKLGSVEATRINQYFEAQSEHAFATTLGAFQVLAESPEKLYWELSRVLSQRIKSNCGLRLEVELINQAQATIHLSSAALVVAFKAFRG